MSTDSRTTMTGSDSLVDSIVLYRRRSKLLRLDVWPFAMVYAALIPPLLGLWGSDLVEIRGLGGSMFGEALTLEVCKTIVVMPTISNIMMCAESSSILISDSIIGALIYIYSI